MVTMPEWDLEFAKQSRRYTRRVNVYRAGRTVVLFVLPWGLAVTPSLHSRPFPAIVAFFLLVLILFVLEQIAWGWMRRQKRRAVSALLYTLPELVFLGTLTVCWWLVFPGHILLAIGMWWVFGVLLALQRYTWRRWALREGMLRTKDYQLFGRRIGRSIKHIRHDRALLYDLPEDSAFRPYTVMVLASDKPEVYVSADARSLLDADQLRTVIAHELGHSWAQHYVGLELAEWIRRLSFVPLVGGMVCGGLAFAPGVWEPVLVFVYLTAVLLIWKANQWVSNVLCRPRELAADRYAVEMTRTPEAFIEGMRRLAEADCYNVFVNIYDTIGLCSHPCIVKRLACVAASLDQPPNKAKRRQHRRQ